MPEPRIEKEVKDVNEENTIDLDADLKQLISIESADLLSDVKAIVELSRKSVYRSVNRLLIIRNWLLGRRISNEVLFKGNDENYGKSLLSDLSKELRRLGKGFDAVNLYYYRRFYNTYPDFLYTLCKKSFIPLSWSHYRILLRVCDDRVREWYEKEASEEMWSVRTLQRNVDSQYYYRIINSSDTRAVGSDTKKTTKECEMDNRAFIKDPVVMEFLGLPQNAKVSETTLENRIISNLQSFLLELGKGFTFVARQQRICTEARDYYIDLVFYNVYLKSYVLIDLKTSRVTHQDVGQMDMYVRMYDDLKRTDGDNPTIGIVLCADTDEDIAKYSVLHDNDQLFAAKYKSYLPSEEELRKEIELQKYLHKVSK